MVWLSGGNMTIYDYIWLFPRGQFCLWTFKNENGSNGVAMGSLFSDKAKSVTSAMLELQRQGEAWIRQRRWQFCSWDRDVGTLGHWRLLIWEFMTFHDLCCCSMLFLYVGSIPHSNRNCSEFGSNAISSTQRCLMTPGTVKMLGAALAPWQNALLVSCWTITSIGGVYGVLWRPETKGIVRVTLCVGIIALAFRFAQALQFLGYLEQPNKGAVLQWRGFQDNDNQQDQANLSETAAPLPSMPYLLHTISATSNYKMKHSITNYNTVMFGNICDFLITE